MSSVRRFLLLARIGRKSDGGGSSAVVHRAGLLVAAAFLTLFAWGLAVAGVTYGDRDVRAAAREGVPAANVDQAVAYWLPSADQLNSRQFAVIYVRATQARAAPPPGLRRWPETGEVFASQQLLDAGGQVAVVRFGNLAGVIADEGLLFPSEWLIYANPDNPQLFANRGSEALIAGFGLKSAFPLTTLDYLNFSFVSEFLPLALPLVGLPVVVLCVVAARSGSEARDKRLARLHALGAPQSARNIVVLGEAAAPIALGVAVAVAVAATTFLTGVQLPATDFAVSATTMTSAAGWLSISAVAAALLMIALTVAMHPPPSTGQGPRPRSPEKHRRWPLIGLPLGGGLVLLSVFAPDALSTVTLAAGICLVGGGLPTLIGGQSARMGGVIASMGTKRESAAAVVGGRWLQMRPATLTRVVGAFVIGTLLAGIVQVIVSRVPGEVTTARAAQAQIQNQILLARSTGLTPETAVSFIDAVGSENVLYAVFDSTSEVLYGECAALQTLGQPNFCPREPTPLDQVFPGSSLLLDSLRVSAGSDVRIVATVLESNAVVDSMIVFNSAGTAGAEQIRRIAYLTLPSPFVTLPGDDWIGGWISLQQLVRWPLTVEMPGIVALVIASLLAAASTFNTQAKSLGPLSTFVVRRRFYIKVALWNIAVPLTICAMISGIVVILITSFLQTAFKSEGSAIGFIAVTTAVVVASGVLFAGLCGLLATKAAAGWHPVRD